MLERATYTITHAFVLATPTDHTQVYQKLPRLGTLKLVIIKYVSIVKQLIRLHAHAP